MAVETKGTTSPALELHEIIQRDRRTLESGTNPYPKLTRRESAEFLHYAAKHSELALTQEEFPRYFELQRKMFGITQDSSNPQP